jgi:hypothetical protein
VEIVRSDDGGQTFTTFDVSAATGGDQLRIAAVDPVDPDRLYLREQGFPDERLMLSSDGGQTIREALTIPRGRLTAFLRRADGGLLAGGVADATGGSIHLSTDGGATFRQISTAIRPGALVERDGVVWASTDNLADGFAVARSADGATWEPVIRYADVAGIKSCSTRAPLAQTCSAACVQELVRGTFTEKTCGLPPPPEPRPDAGPAPTTGDGRGCGCRAAGAPAESAAPALAGGLLVLAWRRRRGGQRRRRARRPTRAARARASRAAPPRFS